MDLNNPPYGEETTHNHKRGEGGESQSSGSNTNGMIYPHELFAYLRNEESTLSTLKLLKKDI